MSRRTIQRDIEFMTDRLGAPIAYDHRRRGYYYTVANFQLPSVRLTEGELVAIFLGQRVLAGYAGSPYEGLIRSAFEKICAALPDSVSLDLAGYDARGKEVGRISLPFAGASDLYDALWGNAAEQRGE